MLLEHGVEIVDGLEFDPALRVTDVGCDLAFLLMDLEGLGSPFAASTVLASYREAGGDPGDDALVAFFGVYRALVRAKVALVRAGQADDRTRRLADARARLALAERLAWRTRHPGLVVVGLSATGKTTFATLLAERSGLRHLSSDPVRKRLADIAPAARADAASYAESFNRRTYAELGGLPADAVVIECRAPLSVRLARADRRIGDSRAYSDADARVVRRQSDDGGLVEAVPPAQHVPLRTDRPVTEALDDLTAVIDGRLALDGP